jgi:serine/threonine protein kinase
MRYDGGVNPEGDRRATADAADASLPKACPSCRSRYSADALFCALDGSPLATSPAAMAALAASDPYIGHEIVGPIEIRQLVGLGGMGRVYRGFQKGIDRDVAVKILHRELSANPTVVARFHREAKVASRLAHPNVVHVLLTGQLLDGAMYMVMEYLDGMSLQSALAASGGAMPLPRALHVALALCDAAGEAHAQGIVHRDLKPENVMLVRRGDDPDFVKVLDFGIARINWGDPSTTAAGLIFGTARYISPEGAQGETVGPPGDVYSIATLLYQMLSGRTPFEGDQAVALLVHQIHDPPLPLKSIARAAYVPDPIAAVVMNNLAKRPEQRAQNARDFGRDLLDAGVASGLSAQDLLLSPGMTRPGATGTGRSAHTSAVQLASMQRTQQLVLEPSVDEQLRRGGVARTVYGPPSSERGDARDEAGRRASAGGRDARAPAKTEIADPASEPGVDATMDERQQPGLTPPASTTAPVRTAAPPSRPSSSFLTTPGDRREGELAPRRPIALLVVACFLAGAVGMAGLASRAGFLGARHAQAPELDVLVSRANDALLHQRWDSPRSDSVRGITDDGLSLWPNEPQLLRIRTLACSDILKTASARRDEGNVGEALRLSKLAYALDPSDVQAQRLTADMEALAQAPPTDIVPPLAPDRPSAWSGPGSSVVALAARATIDASNPKPAVGQPVDFSARVTGGAPGAPGSASTRIDGAMFRVAGPGIAAGTHLEAVADGAGAFRATFAFLQGGRFEVSFGARADGAPVHAARAIDVGAPVTERAPLPLPASSGQVAPAPAPAASAKWL